MGTGAESLSYVNISKSNLIQALKYLVFVQQYKIEILKNNGTAKSPQWVIDCKASPGNLTAIEDLLFGDCETYVHQSRGLMAIKMFLEGPEVILGMAHCDTVLREIQICQVVDKLDLTNFQSVLVQLSPQECLLPVVASNLKTENSTRLTLEKILRAHNIAITEIKPGDFLFGDLMQDLKRLLQDTDFNYLMLDEPEKRVALHSVA
ncbi:DNA mismatch repair protein Msh2, partial [Stegodyphus mimosarum]